MTGPAVRVYDEQGQSIVTDDGRQVAVFKSPWPPLNRSAAERFAEEYKERLHPPAEIQGVFDVMSEWMAMPMPSLTCSEAERLADLARAWGRHLFARQFLYAHSTTDDDESDMHYGMDQIEFTG